MGGLTRLGGATPREGGIRERAPNALRATWFACAQRKLHARSYHSLAQAPHPATALRRRGDFVPSRTGASQGTAQVHGRHGSDRFWRSKRQRGS